MIAVLMDSSRVGASAKIAVRSLQKVRVSGLDGDHIRVLFFDRAGTYQMVHVEEDLVLEMVAGTEYVQALHHKKGRGRVYVDLLAG